MHAIIVGAGIGGLTAGVALRRAGLETTVLERWPELRAQGAGIVLWANAVRALRSLGVPWRELGGEIIRTSQVARPSGRLLSTFDVRAADAHGGCVSLVVARARLLEVLHDLYTRLGGAVRCSAPLTGIGPVLDEIGRPLPPAAILGSGHTMQGDILIGADGVGSVVFRTLHPNAPTRPTGETCWRAVVPWEADRTIPRGLMREVWGHGRRFGINRISESHVFIWAMGRRPTGLPARDLDHLALLREWYGRWASPVPELIERAAECGDEILCHDIRDRAPARQWGRGLVTLLGDAAHPTTPHLGQSGCMAIEDAEALGRWVGASAMSLDRTPEAIAQALRGYEASRQSRTARITRLSHRVGRLGMLRSAIACGVRDLVMAAIPPAVQRRQHRWLTGTENA